MKNKKWILVMIISLSFIVAEGLWGQPLLIRSIKAQPMLEQQLPSDQKEKVTRAIQQALRSSLIENQGQVADEEVAFYGNLANGMIGFGTSKVLLWLEGWDGVVTLHFDGASAVTPIGVDMLETKNHYFLGDRGTYANVRQFGGIVYEDLWEGIDLHYRATSEGLKYEFLVDPEANLGDIRISCKGQDLFSIEEDKLILIKDNRQLIDAGLKVYQEDGVPVEARFITKGSNSFGFQVNNYNKRKSLIIDPLLYSTYVGGTKDDEARSIAIDDTGNAFVTGNTFSNNFPTANAYNDTFAGGTCDCFVFKLSADGSTLLYSTFVGGSEFEDAFSIAVDDSGNAFVTGYTHSSDFPAVNAYDSSYNGGGMYNGDCFVFKLSANGSSLLYSTFIGGSEDDSGKSIVIDASRNVYVTGFTKSSNFPVVNAYNSTYGGLGDCFIFKLSADGSALLYSTFIGGSSDDSGSSIAIDASENVYVLGGTFSSNFPVVKAYNSTYGGLGDCFVLKLYSDGSSLLYSSFIGGSDHEKPNSLAIDDTGSVYGTGFTQSSNFPVVNAYNSTFDGFRDCFVFKLSADGSTLLYSTFVGGSSHEEAFSIAVNDAGNAFVTGTTTSSNFPTTQNAYNNTLRGSSDCFVFQLSAAGSSLLYSTFIGGSDLDLGRSIALDDSGDIFVAGYTHSNNFPMTPNAYDDTLNRTAGWEGDCIVFKLSTDETPTTTEPPTTTTPPETSIPPTTIITTTTVITTIITEKGTFVTVFMLITSLTTISIVTLIFYRRRKRN